MGFFRSRAINTVCFSLMENKITCFVEKIWSYKHHLPGLDFWSYKRNFWGPRRKSLGIVPRLLQVCCFSSCFSFPDEFCHLINFQVLSKKVGGWAEIGREIWRIFWFHWIGIFRWENEFFHRNISDQLGYSLYWCKELFVILLYIITFLEANAYLCVCVHIV